MVWFRIRRASPIASCLIIVGLVSVHRYHNTATVAKDPTMTVGARNRAVKEGRLRTSRIGGGEGQAKLMFRRREQGYNFDCGCPETCTYDVLGSYAGEYKCGDRIAYLISEKGYSVNTACRRVTATEFPNTECGGKCNPDVCLALESPKCGCLSCPNVLDTMAGGHTCGARIDWLVQYDGRTEDYACNRVGGIEYPMECGLCDPDTCEGGISDFPTAIPTGTPTVKLSPKPSEPPSTPAPTPVPTDFPTASPTDAPTVNPSPKPTESPSTSAPTPVPTDLPTNFPSGTPTVEPSLEPTEFPSTSVPTPVPTGSPTNSPSGHPTGTPTVKPSTEPTESPPTSSPTTVPSELPSQIPAPPPTSPLCGCDSCTESVYGTMAGDHSCGERIEWLVVEEGLGLSDACSLVAGVEFSSQCGLCNPDTCNVPPPRCGCDQCTTSDTDSPWNKKAGQYTCGDRIEYLMYEKDHTETEACIKIANEDFPTLCGPACDPTRCGDPPAPRTVAPTYTPVPPVNLYETNLYCFPSSSSRKRFTNVWGKYTVEVKEGTSCGPGNNRFSRETVDVRDSTDLVMQYKMGVSGQWEASEVRVLLPLSELPFLYGTYTFHVKNVSIYKASGATPGGADAAVLPKDLVLGLFTWDVTEDYSVNQNYNHEVDVEVSRWGIDDDPDVQFLVQPPGSPQLKRFFSDGDGGYDQSNQTYSFTWLPGKVSWSGTTKAPDIDATHLYTTEQIMSSGLSAAEDFNQCMPANVEIRINLWNMHGSSTPDGLMVDDVVEVVIGSFQFDPSDEEFVVGGGWCSKHCHCNQLNGYRCVDARCTQEVYTQG